MGNKYTITAGRGKTALIHIGTDNLFVALYNLWDINIDNVTIYWKKLQIN